MSRGGGGKEAENVRDIFGCGIIILSPHESKLGEDGRENIFFRAIFRLGIFLWLVFEHGKGIKSWEEIRTQIRREEIET